MSRICTILLAFCFLWKGSNAVTVEDMLVGATIQLSATSGSPKYYKIDANGDRSIEIVLTKNKAATCPVSPSQGNTEPKMYVSTSLSDVTSENEAMAGYSFEDCSNGDFGQIERMPVSSATTIYIGVVAGGSGMKLRATYVEKPSSSRKKRIVGGEKADPYSIPWQVQLSMAFRDGQPTSFCGGTLVSREWVLTAAHCVSSGIQAKVSSGIKLSVRLGGHYLDGSDSQMIPVDVKDIIVHEDYDDKSLDNDIALIHLQESATLSSRVKTIELPSKSDLPIIKAGFIATVSGWGLLTVTNNRQPEELMRVDVPILAESDCKSLVELSGKTYRDAVICTEAVGKGPCRGDSGGPLFAIHSGRPFLVGLVSYGRRNCGSNGAINTAVYTRAYSFLRWINKKFDSPDKPGNWWKGAKKIPFEYANGGSFIGRPYRGVLHTTESKQYHPSTKTYYGRTGTAPHFTVAVEGSESKVYQHYPISVASRALRSPGSLQTNRANAIQIEIAWKAAEAALMPSGLTNKVSELMRWIESRTGIKRRSPKFYGGDKAYGEKAVTRMSSTEWYDFNGWCGQQHVPHNTHWDPGNIKIDYLLKYGVQDTSYEISIHTGDISQAGTSATISIALAGEWDYTKTYTFSSPDSGSFDQGNVGTVILRTDKVLGSLQRLIIGHDNGGILPGWFVDEIIVTRKEGTNRFVYTFPCKRWLAKDEDDGKTKRVLSLAGVVDEELSYVDTVEEPNGMTVAMVADGLSDCLTTAVRGLSSQILHQLHCDHPDAIEDISSIKELCMPSTLLPYLHKAATTALKAALGKSSKSFVVTSSLRTIAEQYVLYQWSSSSRCGHSQAEDRPGKSDYMKGVAVDVQQYDEFKKLVSASQFQWQGNANPTKFLFSSSTFDVQKALIQSFQKLWNINNPTEKILEDGLYGSQTETALRKAPANGFTKKPYCSFLAPAVPCCVSLKTPGKCVPGNRCQSKDVIGTEQDCVNLPSSVCCRASVPTNTSLQDDSTEQFVYIVEVHTGSQLGAGTNADVYIYLTGSEGSTGRKLLDRIWVDDFERNSINNHSVTSTVNLGQIRSVRIGHDSSLFGSGWYLDKIIVYDLSVQSGAKYTLECNCWLDSSKGFTWTTLTVNTFPDGGNTNRLCFTQTNVLQAKANGAEIVDATIRLIEKSGIFPSDKGLLRKIAWVESKFGTDPNTFRTGNAGVGIWQMDLIGLKDTQNTVSHPKLKDKHQTIKTHFPNIGDWKTVTMLDLHKPLYAGLAARLLLSNIKEAIPSGGDAQALYWKKYYNSYDGKGTKDKFLSDVSTIPQVTAAASNDCENTDVGSSTSDDTKTRTVNRKGSSFCFATVCDSNLYNTIRGKDACGAGHFDAPRGQRTHSGIDIVCEEQSTVRAPFPAEIIRQSKPYTAKSLVSNGWKDGPYNDGLLIQGRGEWSNMCARMWYFKPLKTTKGTVLAAGQVIGTSYDHPCRRNGKDIINHIHIEVYRITASEDCEVRNKNYIDITDRAVGCKGTVKDAVMGIEGCSPVSSHQLAVQIIQQAACKHPEVAEVMTGIDNLCLSSNVFPYLSKAASSSLRTLLNSPSSGVFTVSDCLEPLPHQYIRKQWASSGLCNVQSTGSGAFVNGTAIRVAEASLLNTVLSGTQWELFSPPSNSFRYLAGTKTDTTSLQVRAFQELWKANYPQSTISPTGMLDKQTEDALLQAPLSGFPSGAQCRIGVTPGVPCCTGDKQKGVCIERAKCPDAKERNGPCSNIPNTVCCVGIPAWDVQFPSGETLQPIFPPAAQQMELEDPDDSGTPLFDGNGKQTLSASTNFVFGEFMDPTTRYFRLSPVLVSCLQSVRNKANEPIIVKKSYQTRATSIRENNGTTLYRTGAAAVIQFKSKNRAQPLTELVLRHCLPVIRNKGKDVGLGFFRDSIHVDLRDVLSAWSQDAATMTTAGYKAWVTSKLRQIEDEAVRLPSCTDISPFPYGTTYPNEMTAEEACGNIDGRIKRYTEEFSRLVQFAGDQAYFENEERSEAWCGVPGRPCVDCRSSIAGSSTELKCADRMMTERLEDRIWRLARLVRKEWPKRKLIVHDAWDEPNAMFPEGQYDGTSLHYEGRLARVSVSDEIKGTISNPSSDDTLLGELGALSVCAGFDHVVYNSSDSIEVSVKKSDGVGTLQTFPNAQFLCVLPPVSDSTRYTINETDPRWLPTCLHDSGSRLQELLADPYTVEDFVSSDYSRYFRLHPALAESLIEVANIMKRDFNANVTVVRGYDTQTTGDQSHRLHSYGQGLEIELQEPVNATVEDLATAVIERAGHEFRSNGLGFGIELGQSTVYYHVQTQGVDTWVADDSPMIFNDFEEVLFDVKDSVIEDSSITSSEFEEFVSQGLDRAFRRIEPANEERSCSVFPPMPLSPHYEWQPSPSRLPSVRPACSNSTDLSQFCRDTEKYREEQVESLWNELADRHFIRRQQDIKDALINCMQTYCGKCIEGAVWEQKVKHCNNFVHWLPLGFGETENNGAIYLRENSDARQLACTTVGSNCIEKTEVYSVISPRLGALYPLKEGKSAKDEIFSSASNPSPLYEIMQQVFVMHLEGTVSVYANDRSEMSSLRNAIKALMAYNPNVTMVTIYASSNNVDKVREWLENNIIQWTATVCPQHGRKYIAEYEVQEMPSLPEKRDAGSFYEQPGYNQLRIHEMEWLAKL